MVRRDMYMIGFLQTQAYYATRDPKYIRRAAKEMALYLDRLQLASGLFDHADGVPYRWGRGNGWMAAAMPMILRWIEKDDPNRARINGDPHGHAPLLWLVNSLLQRKTFGW